MATKSSLSNPAGPHLSKRNFDRFEPHLKSVELTYPSTCTFVPTDLAPTTFIARLRDAANAYLIHGFESILDHDTFELAWKGSIAIVQEGKIVVGPKDQISSALRAAVETEAVSEYFCQLVKPDLETLHALTVLYQKGIIVLPSRFTQLPPGTETIPGFVAEPQSDGTYLML